MLKSKSRWYVMNFCNHVVLSFEAMEDPNLFPCIVSCSHTFYEIDFYQI